MLTPCTKTCAVNPAGTHCASCHRSLAEIEHWTTLTDAQRAAIMAALPARAPLVAQMPPQIRDEKQHWTAAGAIGYLVRLNT